AQQLARAASAFEQQRTGHPPRSVTVVLSGDTLVLTLHGALSPAEQALAKTPAGAAQVQEFHRQLFNSSAAWLRQEIKRITGVEGFSWSSGRPPRVAVGGACAAAVRAGRAGPPSRLAPTATGARAGPPERHRRQHLSAHLHPGELRGRSHQSEKNTAELHSW